MSYLLGAPATSEAGRQEISRSPFREITGPAEPMGLSSRLLATFEDLFEGGFVSRCDFLTGQAEDFAYLSLARARAAGSRSSGGSGTQVRTYCKRQFVSATCVCTSVKRGCTSLPMLKRVAAMRASRSSIAPALSPRSNSFWQAAIRNACSDRKPRPLIAVRRGLAAPRKLRGRSLV